jgi:hypothetical protein
MATRYLDVQVLKAWRRDETSTTDDLIEDAINAATQSIDNKLKRRIVLATTSSARVFTPLNSDMLFIDDCTGVTSITENGTVLVAGTDYQLEPLNGLSESGETVPYYKVQRLGGGNWYRDGQRATVSIVAAWGWAAIPSQVVEACKVIAADMLRNPDMRFGLVDISEAGGVGSRENKTVTDMIAAYRYAVRTFGIA